MEDLERLFLQDDKKDYEKTMPGLQQIIKSPFLV